MSIVDEMALALCESAGWWDIGLPKRDRDQMAQRCARVVAKHLRAKADTMEAEDTGEDGDASTYVENAAHALREFADELDPPGGAT